MTEEQQIEAYRRAARENHYRDGELEIDGNAVVSLGDDPGAYVQAWVWVTAAEAGVPHEDDED